MAQGLLEARLPDDLRDRVAVSSAGSFGMSGAPAAVHAVEIAADAGIDLRSHEARRYAPEMAAEADMVLALDEGNRDFVLGRSPAQSTKIFCLREAAGAGTDDEISIRDPFGGDTEDYRHCFEEIESEIENLMPRLRQWLESRAVPRRNDEA